MLGRERRHMGGYYVNKAVVQTGKALGFFGVYLLGQIAGGMAAGMITLFQIMMERGSTDGDHMSQYSSLVSRNLGYGLIIAAILTILAYWVIFRVRKKSLTKNWISGRLRSRRSS